ncbi:MAG: cytochrome C [Candidatus Dadabacteria bacterium]|nr:cytochrome C [Candidatus Dadabacteria bacterium]
MSRASTVIIEERPEPGKVTEITSWVPGPMPHGKRRYAAAALSLVAVVLLMLSLMFPYWSVVLNAPQYPDGLHVQVHLTKIEGDTFEIDLLNHYIGMKKLEEAARFERSIALYGLAFISLFTLLFVFSGRRWMSLLALPALVFPIAFIMNMMFWLYRFGHDLDPRAPITFEPFTPRLIGEGKIGQFSTVGSLDVGFYLALGSLIFVLAALLLRFTVCNACPYKNKCSLACPYLFLWPPPEHSETAAQ